MAAVRFRQPSALPGFGLALGSTLFYLGIIVLLPLAALVAEAAGLGLRGIWTLVAEPRVLAALRTSFGLALAAALVDSVFGLLIAWVLTRYHFPGRRLLDAAVDLPFAPPPAVAGLALATLYAPHRSVGGRFAGFRLQGQGAVRAGGAPDRSRLGGAAVPGAPRAAADRRARPQQRGGVGGPGGEPLADDPAGDRPDARTRHPDRLRARLRARGERVRI